VAQDSSAGFGSRGSEVTRVSGFLKSEMKQRSKLNSAKKQYLKTREMSRNLIQVVYFICIMTCELSNTLETER